MGRSDFEKKKARNLTKYRRLRQQILKRRNELERIEKRDARKRANQYPSVGRVLLESFTKISGIAFSYWVAVQFFSKKSLFLATLLFALGLGYWNGKNHQDQTIIQLKAENSSLEKNLMNQKRKVEEFQQKYNESAKSNITLTNKIHNLTKDNTNLESKQKELTNQLNKKKEEKKKIEDALAKQKEIKFPSKQEISRWQDQIKELKEDKKRLESEMREKNQEIMEIVKSYQQILKDVEELKRKIKQSNFSGALSWIVPILDQIIKNKFKIP